MTFRRRKAPARVGAGILLAAACTLAPAAAMAAPEDGAELTQTEMCEAPTLSAASAELGEPVTISGECVGTGSFETIVILVDGAQVGTEQSRAGGTFEFTYTPKEAGDYRATALLDGETVDYADFTVTEVDPAPEAPDESEDPEEPGADEGDEDLNENDGGTDEGDGVDPDAGNEDEGEDGTDGGAGDGTGEDNEDADEGDEGTEGGDNTGTGGNDQNSGDENGTDGNDQTPGGDSRTEDNTSNPTGDAADTSDDSTPLPSASDDPSASAGEPASPEAPASPDTPPNEAAQPESGPTAAQQRSLSRALELGELLAGMNGQSGESSDGEEELAATGVELSAGAALAFVTLGSGAGLVWSQRRPRED